MGQDSIPNYQFPAGVVVMGDFPRMQPHSIWSSGVSANETINGPAPYWATYAERDLETGGITVTEWSSKDTVHRTRITQNIKGEWKIYNAAKAIDVLLGEIEKYRSAWLKAQDDIIKLKDKK